MKLCVCLFCDASFKKRTNSCEKWGMVYKNGMEKKLCVCVWNICPREP